MKALVTGGGGFLGSAIVRMLAARGDHVRIFARGDYLELRALGVETMRGDISDEMAVVQAAQGCDAIFHVAAKPGVWGSAKEFHLTNVVGTQNVLTACEKNQIPKLIHTSSASVVFDGRDMIGVDETVGYPDHYEARYPETKAIAEKMVLQANDDRLATVALRPHLIWGPGDPHLIPRILARARSLRIVGDGKNLVDTVHVENAAEAHLLAADRLAPGSPVAGKAYFITQEEPKPLWEIINRILDADGLPPVTKTISPRLAVAAGWMMEMTYGLLGIAQEPKMTRFVARELSTSHWFDISAARRDLCYAPRVSFEEGMERLRQWLRSRKHNRS